MKRLLLECGVVALAAWGLYRWKFPPAEPVAPVTPAYTDGRPDLDMTGTAPTLRPPKVASSMLVAPGSLTDDSPAGRRGRPGTLGSTPRLLSAPGAAAEDAAAASSPAAATPWDAWLRRLRRFGGPRAVIEIFALFLVGYLLLARGLRRGNPHSLTHD